jgi:HD superfamily phosphohydrolase/DNA-binding transcriptional ArsR family regulator
MSYEFRDPIYGDIVLTENEVHLVDTYEMQRLRHIKQLGNVSLAFHGANHTRFEHSLGTRWLAQKIVRISNLPISMADEKLLYKCALLHDVAEPAFAHATERLSSQGLPTHEQIIDYVLDGTYKKKVLERKDVDCNFVCDIIKNKEERDQLKSVLSGNVRNCSKPFIRELIKGYVDADCLDYLRRDAFYLGLPYGNYDDRIFASFRLVKHEGQDHIAFRDSEDAINAIISILDSRYVLRRAAYLHHAVIIADDMLLDALKMALGAPEQSIDLYDIFTCGDYELLFKMMKSPAATRIYKLLYRTLFKRVYVVDNQAPSETKESVHSLENDFVQQSDFVYSISEKTGAPPEKIDLNFSPSIGWKDFNRILLVADDGKIKRLNDKLPGDLSLLKEKYESLWRFMVSGDFNRQDERKAVLQVCKEYFAYGGSFMPKKSFDEIAEAKDQLTPILDVLRKNKSSVAILRVLVITGRPMSRDEIAAELRLKPSTVSHYLSSIETALSKVSENLLLGTRQGRIKQWRVDRRLKEVLDSF